MITEDQLAAVLRRERPVCWGDTERQTLSDKRVCDKWAAIVMALMCELHPQDKAARVAFSVACGGADGPEAY